MEKNSLKFQNYKLVLSNKEKFLLVIFQCCIKCDAEVQNAYHISQLLYFYVRVEYLSVFMCA